MVMTIRATIAEPVEPTVESVFGLRFRLKRARQEWRLIRIGFRGKVLRVLVVYLNRKAAV
jgi:hypothetical protein